MTHSSPKHFLGFHPHLRLGALGLLLPWLAAAQPVLKPETFRHYVEEFNAQDEELYPQHIPNAAAWNWISTNVPLFESPDPELEEIYYFRWWTYRKHIKQTPDGFIVTEFLPPVPWSGKHHSINCPAGHHFYEGRWLRDPRYLDDCAVFWFRKGGEPRKYSFWAADSIYARSQVLGDERLARELLPDLTANYQAWEKSHLDGSGLFWQGDGNEWVQYEFNAPVRLEAADVFWYDDPYGIEVNPLVPEGTWNSFCLDHVRYHGRDLTILYDKTGGRYGRGKGLQVLANGRQIAGSESLQRLTGQLP